MSSEIIKWHGLKQQIADAKTIEEVMKLVSYGKTNFTNASDKTRRAWMRTASKRLVELRG